MGKRSFVAAVCLLLLSSGMVSLTGAAAINCRSPSPSHSTAISANFPDPSILKVNGTWWGFATSTTNINVQVATSPNFNDWEVAYHMDGSQVDALPTLGDWVIRDKHGDPQVWAPNVIERDDGTFLLYYSALAEGNLHCVGYAVSDTIRGPYENKQDTPLICDKPAGGAIDASGFKDADGKRYVLWKVDGNAIGHGGSCKNGKHPQIDTPIMIQRVEADGITPLGDPAPILHRTSADGPLVEAPSLIHLPGGAHVLFFSSGCFTEPSYNVRFAVSTSGVFGPYARATEALMRTGDGEGLESPGSSSAVWVEGEDGEDGEGMVYFAFHAGPADYRQMYTRKMQFAVEGGGAEVF